MRESDAQGLLVAGVSGGGDSNALIEGIRAHLGSSAATGVVCFTLVMDPIWPDSAADRARALCVDAGLTHEVLGPDDIADVLGMSASPRQLWTEFAGRYGPDTSHFFGTFLINLVGQRLCEKISGRHLLLGYNREDVFAELLFCLVNGRRPMPFPSREINGVVRLMPLWDLPKAMLDGCYPKYSESNYAERIDTTTVQRSSIYFVAHCVDALVPQLSISLMRGVQQLMNDLSGWQELTPVGGTPLAATGHGDQRAESDLIALLREFFPGW